MLHTSLFGVKGMQVNLLCLSHAAVAVCSACVLEAAGAKPRQRALLSCHPGDVSRKIFFKRSARSGVRMKLGSGPTPAEGSISWEATVSARERLRKIFFKTRGGLPAWGGGSLGCWFCRPDLSLNARPCSVACVHEACRMLRAKASTSQAWTHTAWGSL